MMTPKRQLSTLIFACLCFKKEVMKDIPESDRAEEVKNIDLDLDKLPM